MVVTLIVDLHSRHTQALVFALRASTDRAVWVAQERRGQRSSAVCAQFEAKRSGVNMFSCSLCDRFFLCLKCWWWWSLACQGSVSSPTQFSRSLLLFLAHVVQECCGASDIQVTCWFLPSVPSVAVLLQVQCFLRCGGRVQAWLVVWYCCSGKAVQRFTRSSMWNSGFRRQCHSSLHCGRTCG